MVPRSSSERAASAPSGKSGPGHVRACGYFLLVFFLNCIDNVIGDQLAILYQVFSDGVGERASGLQV